MYSFPRTSSGSSVCLLQLCNASCISSRKSFLSSGACGGRVGYSGCEVLITYMCLRSRSHCQTLPLPVIFVFFIVLRRISNPYSLPCGHTFCLRPCLLSNASATTSYCVQCRATCDVAELRPNYAILIQLNQLSWQQQQQQQQQQNSNQNRNADQQQASRQNQAPKHQTKNDGSDPLISLFHKV